MSSESFPNPHGFSRRNGQVYCEDIPLTDLADQFGTPLYVYSLDALTHAVNDWKKAVQGTPHRVFYAMKANSNLGILHLFRRLGLGFDIVSGGELARALAVGANGKDIVYSGVGKSCKEIASALSAGIECFNVESIPELDRIQSVAERLDLTASISVRVNPNVDAKTHPYISTGLKNNKFGVAYESVSALYQKAATLPNIRISGIDAHIGSQITQVEPFTHAADKILDLVDELAKLGIKLDHIDFGGGLGVRYNDETPPTAVELVSAISERCKARGYGDMPLFFEPGRSLVAMSGALLTTVEFLKPTTVKNFCIVDAAMNDMVRPTLYQADMTIENCTTHATAPTTWDIVGPVSESGDWLGRERTLSIETGDRLVMTGAGAYGMSMASNYNSRCRPAEILVDGNETHMIRKRETMDDIMHNELIPQKI